MNENKRNPRRAAVRIRTAVRAGKLVSNHNATRR
jgi:hypothetical protein